MPKRSKAKRRSSGAFAWLATLAMLGAVLAGGFVFSRGFYLLDLESRIDHPLYETLRPAGLIGHGYGIVGTALMVTNLLYLARRRLSFMQFGSMKAWLDMHVLTGLSGAALVLLHSALQLRTAIAGVTAASLGIVVLTGVVGRFLYAIAPRVDMEAFDEELDRLDALLPGASSDVRSALHLHPASSIAGDLTLTRNLLSIPGWRKVLRYRRAAVVDAITLHERAAVLEAEASRDVDEVRSRLAALAAREIRAAIAAAFLRSWRGLHRFLAVLLVILIPVHIAVAWVLGYRWVFS